MLHISAAAVEGRDNQSLHSKTPLILTTSLFHNRGEIDWSLDYSGNPASSRKLSCRTLVSTLYSRFSFDHLVDFFTHRYKHCDLNESEEKN